MNSFAALGKDPTLHTSVGAQALEKQALAKLLAKGMTGLGKVISTRAGNAGAAMARNAIRESGGIAAVGGRQAASRMQSAGRIAGRHNSTIGEALRQGGATLGRSKGLQKAVNYGGGAALAGAGLYGANRAGHRSGVAEGLMTGTDAGLQTGVDMAFDSMQQNQPGYLGGLWNAAKGSPYGDLESQRAMLTNQLMGGRI